MYASALSKLTSAFTEMPQALPFHNLGVQLE